ncbi:MAG: molybdopterin-guanine dinucleotide biosynthesis protein B [Gemmatimonadota bacterium]|nr:molybdopterin-guanine dinucleotide biosynthesis protein B [Gemmatimonadota bacterium]
MTSGGRTLGAVLSGGRSTRFGSDKALAELGGVTLLDRAVRTLREVCDEVVVVSSRPEHDGAGRVRIPDLRAGAGPLAGLESALRHAERTGAGRVVALACDLPDVDQDLVRRLLDTLGEHRAVALERVGKPGFEPLCAVYRTACAHEAVRLLDSGVRGAHRLLEAVDGGVMPSPGPVPTNVNTTADLHAVKREPGVMTGRRVSRGAGSASDEGDPTVVCVVGKKKSGKTTTVVGLVSELASRGYEVMTVKHGHGFDLDREGTDSWRHRHQGKASRVALVGPEGFAVVGGWGREDDRREPSLETLVARHLGDADIVVAEGFKASGAPRIEVFRTEAHPEPLYGTDVGGAEDAYLAVLTDDRTLEAACPVLDVSDPDRFTELADLVEALHRRRSPSGGG